MRKATEVVVSLSLHRYLITSPFYRYSHPDIHPCADLCHAPGSCLETEPCTATVIITCSCGRIRQSVQCGRKLSNSTGGEGSKTLTCTNECAIAKRNARLAEALGISSDRTEKNKVTYRDELITFARANSKFIPVVEKSFAEYVIQSLPFLRRTLLTLITLSFVRSDKKTLLLPKMPPDRRKFVQEVDPFRYFFLVETYKPFPVGYNLQDGHPASRSRTTQKRPTNP